MVQPVARRHPASTAAKGQFCSVKNVPAFTEGGFCCDAAPSELGDSLGDDCRAYVARLEYRAIPKAGACKNQMSGKQCLKCERGDGCSLLALRPATRLGRDIGAHEEVASRMAPASSVDCRAGRAIGIIEPGLAQ